MKLLDIYSYLISNWLNAGNFVNAGRMEATSIKPEYNVIFTKGYCKQIVQVVGIKPINIDICFITSPACLHTPSASSLAST